MEPRAGRSQASSSLDQKEAKTRISFGSPQRAKIRYRRCVRSTHLGISFGDASITKPVTVITVLRAVIRDQFWCLQHQISNRRRVLRTRLGISFGSPVSFG